MRVPSLISVINEYSSEGCPVKDAVKDAVNGTVNGTVNGACRRENQSQSSLPLRLSEDASVKILRTSQSITKSHTKPH